MRIKRKLDKRVSIDMAPMVDIVFLLIIFFMVATTFVKTTGINVNLPKATSTQAETKNNLIITITKQGTLFLNNDQVSLSSLASKLKNEKLKTGQDVVIIKGDRNIRFASLVRVMDIAKLSGISKISLASERKTLK